MSVSDIDIEADDAPPASEMMDEGELQSVLRAEFDDARDYHTSQLGNERQKAGYYYIGAKFGNEQEGRSAAQGSQLLQQHRAAKRPAVRAVHRSSGTPRSGSSSGCAPSTGMAAA